MTPAVPKGGSRRGPDEIRDAIDRFLGAAKKPVVFEPGEESIPLVPNNYALETKGNVLLLQAWDERRNLVRRISGISSESRGRLDLHFERFDKKFGTVSLVDEAQGQTSMRLRTARLGFREHFRRFLRRQFPSYRIAELSTEANLQDSLSPAYPRALLRDGASAWAAIGASSDCLQIDGVLSFGLIWLDHLRRRERKSVVRGLILLLPAGAEKTTCLRMGCLDASLAEFRVFAYTEDGFETSLDLSDYGNLDTRLERVQRPVPSVSDELLDFVRVLPGVEMVERGIGVLSLRVHGLEFARTAGDSLLYGLETNRVANASNLAEIKRLAEVLARLRSTNSLERDSPLFLRGRELWLESQVRADLETIDASLLPTPLYEQAPTFAGGDRGIIDLLACDRSGRLAVLELKASEDIHLPLQALHYWMRVKWHLAREEFGPAGYFPGIQLRQEAPRIMLIAPALDFHPSNERILRYFSPAVPVERIGVGAGWQSNLQVMFRM